MDDNLNGQQDNADDADAQNVTGNDTMDDAGGQTDDAGAVTTDDIVTAAAQVWDGFDPSRHAVNPDGTPRVKADGTYAMKRGRKPGQQPAPKGGDAPAVSRPDPGPAKSAKAARQANLVTNAAAARMMTAAGVGALIATLGDQWDFENKEEADAMVGAVTEYLNAKGQTQMTPETMLLLSSIGYIAPRAAHPETKSRLARFADWAKSGLQAIFRR